MKYQLHKNMTKKRKILLLSDDLRTTSGIATMSHEFVLHTCDEFDWVQLGALIKHPDEGKILDLSQSIQQELHIPDASVKIYPISGYGNAHIVRQLIDLEKPDAILHFTDPRSWIWLYQIEYEIRQKIPILYYTIWDDTPYPYWNTPYYRSCDSLMCINKQTYNICKHLLKDYNYQDWQISYIPHGINGDIFHPIVESDELNKLNEFKTYHQYDKYSFIVFYNARNQQRKHISDIILGWNDFNKTLTPEQRSKCLLLLHTLPIDNNGTDLPAVIKYNTHDCNIQFTGVSIISQSDLNLFYNLASCTINIASNEGFGLGTAESIMAGTPIIVNVTGGLQDQCGFKKEDGTYITENDFNDDFQTNAEGQYTKHGEWVYPIYPSNRSLLGSPATPYIFDDRASYKDLPGAFRYWFEKTPEDRRKCALKGREYFNDPKVGISSKEMCRRMKDAINISIDNFKPSTPIYVEKL
jgi:glycosyltransferase involved in cell wall biosynthesis